MARKTLAEFLDGETRFGRLTVLEEIEPVGVGARAVRRARCQCECGSETVVRLRNLKTGGTVSCGCHRASLNPGKAQTNRTHGDATSRAPEYRAWEAMKRRCEDENYEGFHRYGGRGIAVCPEWRGDYARFLADMGRRPSPAHSLDRTNNDLDYSKANCRWATAKQQGRNRGNTQFIECRGKRYSMSEFCEGFNLTRQLVRDRISYGWDIEKIATTPKRQRR